MQWPSQSLRTPDVDRHAGHRVAVDATPRPRRRAFLAPDDAPSQADAVVYLMRHLHATDVRFLESFHDQGVARADPGQHDRGALAGRRDRRRAARRAQSARRIARRYRADDKIRGLCQTVVAVAGLLAQTGRTMRQQEFAALTALAALPRTELDGMLLSVDRFAAACESALDADARARLIDRFGLFGVRLGATLIRQGVDRPAALAAELVRRSGLDDLRSLLTTQFAERRDLLKARSALLAVDLVLTREPRPAAAPLAAEVERILAGAHEFAELRLLATIRAGVVKLPPDALDGGGAAAGRRRRRRRRPGWGSTRTRRPPSCRRPRWTRLGRWQRRAESPMSEPRGVRRRPPGRPELRGHPGRARRSPLGTPPTRRPRRGTSSGKASSNVVHGCLRTWGGAQRPPRRSAAGGRTARRGSPSRAAGASARRGAPPSSPR